MELKLHIRRMEPQDIPAAAQIEKQLYPVNAKEYLKNQNLPITTYTRTKNHHEMSPLFSSEVKQLELLTEWIQKQLQI